jgi:hypothetical protein
MRSLQGALIIAGVFQAVIGFFGIWRVFIRFLSPLAAVPFVTLSALGLFYFAFPGVAKCIEIGLPTLVLLIIFAEVLFTLCLLPFQTDPEWPLLSTFGTETLFHFFFCLAVRLSLLRGWELRVRPVRRAGDGDHRVDLRRDTHGGRRLQREEPGDAVRLPHRQLRPHPRRALVQAQTLSRTFIFLLDLERLSFLLLP